MILVFLFVALISPSYSQSYSKGFGEIEWGTLSSDILKTAKTQKTDTVECSTVFQQFLPSTNIRKHLDAKRIYPGLPFAQNEEIIERKNIEIKMRYRIESDPRAGCKIYFDEKYFGHYLEKSEGRYQDFLSYYISRWGHPVETEKDCEVPCVSKYRVYFFKMGDTHVLAQVTPYNKALIFAYSKKIANEILGIMNLPQDLEQVSSINDSFSDIPVIRKKPGVNKEIIKTWSEEKLFDFALEKMFFDAAFYAAGEEDAIYALETSDRMGHTSLKEERVKLRNYLLQKITRQYSGNSSLTLPFPELKMLSLPECLPVNGAFCQPDSTALELLVKEFPTHPMSYVMLAEKAKIEQKWDQFKIQIDHINMNSFVMTNKWDRLYKKFALVQKAAHLTHEKKIIEANKLFEENLHLFASEYPYIYMANRLFLKNDEKDQNEVDRLYQKAVQLNDMSRSIFLKNYYSYKLENFNMKKKYKECINFFSEMAKIPGAAQVDAYGILGSCYEKDHQYSNAAVALKGSCVAYDQNKCRNYFENLEKAKENVEQVTEEYCQNGFEIACLTRALNFAKKKDVQNGFKYLKLITTKVQGLSTLRMGLSLFTNEERELLKTVSEFQGEKIEIPAPDSLIPVKGTKVIQSPPQKSP